VTAPDGTPAADVRIAAYEDRRLVRAYGASASTYDLEAPEPDATATSDAQGAFTMKVPTSAMYVVSLDKPGFARLFVGLVAGAPDAPSVVLPMMKGARFEGRVVDDDGKPIVGASLTGGTPVSYDDGYVPNTFARRGATTDPDGRFVIRDVFLGEEKDDDRFGWCAVAVRLAPDRRVVRSGPETDASGQPFSMVARGDVSFDVRVVTNAGGKPLAGASVMALWAVGDEDLPTYVQAWATTDAQGACRFDGLPKGRIRAVEAIVPGHGVATWSTPCCVGSPTSSPTSAEVRVAKGPSCSGTVTDEAGEPLGGVEVRAVLFRGATATSTRSGADGTYRLLGMPAPPAESPLMVEAQGRVRLWPYEPATSTATPGEFTMPIRLVKPASISGRVVDEAGQGVGGAELRLGRRSVLVGEDGSFLVLGLERDDQQHVRTGHPDDVRADWNVSRASALATAHRTGVSRRFGEATVHLEPGQRVENVTIVVRPSK
jgi:hypothetical protein